MTLIQEEGRVQVVSDDHPPETIQEAVEEESEEEEVEDIELDPELIEELKRVKIKVCPNCGGPIGFAGMSLGPGFILPGFHTAQMYVCDRCGYQGSLVLEVSDEEALEIVKELKREHLKRKKHPPKDREEGSAKFQPIPDKYVWFWKLVLVLILGFLFLVFIGFLRPFTG